MTKYIYNITKRFTLKDRVRRKMLKNYRATNYANEILEKWITQQTLSGKPRREELKKKRAEIEETAKFINFVKTA